MLNTGNPKHGLWEKEIMFSKTIQTVHAEDIW